MIDFDPRFLPVLGVVLAVLAVEAALLGVGVAVLWWLAGVLTR